MTVDIGCFGVGTEVTQFLMDGSKHGITLYIAGKPAGQRSNRHDYWSLCPEDAIRLGLRLIEEAARACAAQETTGRARVTSLPRPPGDDVSDVQLAKLLSLYCPNVPKGNFQADVLNRGGNAMLIDVAALLGIASSEEMRAHFARLDRENQERVDDLRAHLNERIAEARSRRVTSSPNPQEAN